MWAVSRAGVSTYDDRNRRIDSIVDNPDLNQIRLLIDKLDGDRISDMYIEGSNRHVLTIVGGSSDFGLTVIGDNLGPYELLGDDPSDEMTHIKAGGVSTAVPRRFIVTRQRAQQAAEFFVKNGTLDPLLDWHLD